MDEISEPELTLKILGAYPPINTVVSTLEIIWEHKEAASILKEIWAEFIVSTMRKRWLALAPTVTLRPVDIWVDY